MKVIKFKDLYGNEQEIDAKELIKSELLFMKHEDHVIVITQDNKHYDMNAETFSRVITECAKSKLKDIDEGFNGAREEIEHYIN